MLQVTYQIHPIGRIQVQQDKGLYRLEIDPPYRPAMQGLESCTHCIVLW